MPRKREKEPTVKKIETKEKSRGEELSDSEKIDLLIEVYTTDLVNTNYEYKRQAKERYLKDFEGHPEEVSEKIKESELNPEQLRFLKRCMTELNRRGEIAAVAGTIGKYFIELPNVHQYSGFYSDNEILLEGKLKDWAKVKELERLLKESEEASTEFIIPGSDADRSGKLSFNLNEAKWWKNAFISFNDARDDIRWSESRKTKPSERQVERLSKAEEKFRRSDGDFKKLIEEFEKEKSKANIPAEELEEARKKTKEAFEEGKGKE